jgi:flagellar FliJ protein
MAKKFTFRLASVLKYRQILEDDQKRELAHRNAAISEKQQQEDQLTAQRTDALTEMRQLTDTGTVNLSALTATRHYIAATENALLNVKTEKIRLQQEAETTRLAFVAARRDKRAVELLKEKRFATYRYETDREHQAELDEAALSRRTTGIGNRK